MYQADIRQGSYLRAQYALLKASRLKTKDLEMDSRVLGLRRRYIAMIMRHTNEHNDLFKKAQEMIGDV
jgi:hypothetical protein